MRIKQGIAAALATVVTGLSVAEVRAQDFVWPVSGRVTQWYWTRTWYGYHRAIDIAGSYWSPVGASRGGCVWRGWGGGYGNLVIVYHTAGYRTYYAHNIRFGAGGCVGRGATISYRGSTGWSTGPHVHFEIRRWSAILYLPAGGWCNKGWGVPWNYPYI